MMNFRTEFLEGIYSAFPHLDCGIRLSRSNQKRLLAIIDSHGYTYLVDELGNLRLFLRMVTLKTTIIPRCRVCDVEMVQRHCDGRLYCSMRCYKADPSAGRRISERKSELYSNEEWKAEVERKRKETMLRKHSVEFSMQSPIIREKHQKTVCRLTNIEDIQD